MKILLVGATGAMGQVVSELVKESKDEIIAGIGLEDSSDYSYPVYSDINMVKEEVDVIIDFSVPENIHKIIEYGKAHSTPLVLSTTGYTEEEENLIKDASKDLPILKSGNMSLGVNLMKSLVSKMTQVLEDFDIEIVEAHHNKKVDSPSGTANLLLNSIKENREVNEVVYGREGRDTKRKKNDVGIHSIRGGTIVGEHSVIFAGEDEILEIKHQALSKKIFANGALNGARYIINKENGLYDMDDVIGN